MTQIAPILDLIYNRLPEITVQLVSISNLIVHWVSTTKTGTLIINSNHDGGFKYEHAQIIPFRYYNGLWVNHWNIVPRHPHIYQYQFTEKTAVKIAVAIMCQSDIEYRDEALEIIKHYSITKLMLLREMVAMHLVHDLLIAIFDVTE